MNDSSFIEVIPLRSGDTINLDWQWDLPAQTGNDVQGDGISFTINYLLTEFETNDVSDIVDNVTGTFKEDVTVEVRSGKAEITITENTTGETQEGAPLSEIWLIEIDKEPLAPSEDTTTVGSHYDAGPDGTTFDQPITITLDYNPDELPERVREENLFIATWDVNTGQWVELEGGTIDTVNHTISTQVSHFSRYTVIAHVPPPPPPPQHIGVINPSPPRKIEPPPPTTGKEEPAASLETNMLGKEQKVEIEADGILRKALNLTDPDGNFVIEIDSGSKITGSDGILLTRIELTVVEESVAVPEDTVILSSTYKLTGYINEVESSQINFNPPAKLTISYNPRDLPENVLLPFVARYTADQILVPLEPPPGVVVEIGKATAGISHASLFFVAAKLIPPPPPLPPKFEVSNLIINPRQGRIGQPVSINLEIANDGETAGSYQLQLKIDGIVRAVKEIILAAKSTEKVSFEIRNMSVGKHDVEIAGISGNFRIISTAVVPSMPAVDWLTLDLTIGAVMCATMLALYLFRRRL